MIDIICIVLWNMLLHSEVPKGGKKSVRMKKKIKNITCSYVNITWQTVLFFLIKLQ